MRRPSFQRVKAGVKKHRHLFVFALSFALFTEASVWPELPFSSVVLLVAGLAMSAALLGEVREVWL